MKHYARMAINLSICLFISNGALFSKVALANNANAVSSSIDSLCIYEAKPGELVALTKCGLSANNQQRHIVKGNTALSDKGYIGYYYRSDTQSGQAVSEQGYSYYRIVGQIGHQQIVQTVNNTGGSGEFTGLYRLTNPDPKHIVVYPIALGDRCNGGIVQAKIQNTTLQFEQNITGYSLFSLMQKNTSTSQQLSPFKDLSDCAVCCVGKASYQVKTGAWRHPQLQHIELSKDLNQLTDNNQGKYQNCFNQLLVSTQQPDSNIIKPDQFSKIMHLFMSQCVTTQKQ